LKTEKPLLLNGKPIDLRRPTPCVDRILEYLDKLPDNEIQDVSAVVTGAQASKDRIQTAAKTDPRLASYHVLTSAGTSNRRYLFGNPRAIKALRKLIEAQS